MTSVRTTTTKTMIKKTVATVRKVAAVKTMMMPGIVDRGWCWEMDMDMACKISKEVSVIEILVSLVSLTLYCRTCRFRCKLQNFPIALCLSLVDA